MTWPTASLTSSETSTRQPSRSAARAIASAIGPPPATTSLVTGRSTVTTRSPSTRVAPSSCGVGELGVGDASAVQVGDQGDRLPGDQPVPQVVRQVGGGHHQAAHHAALRQPGDQRVDLAQLDVHQPARPGGRRLAELPVERAVEQRADAATARGEGDGGVGRRPRPPRRPRARRRRRGCRPPNTRGR